MAFPCSAVVFSPPADASLLAVVAQTELDELDPERGTGPQSGGQRRPTVSTLAVRAMPTSTSESRHELGAGVVEEAGQLEPAAGRARCSRPPRAPIRRAGAAPGVGDVDGVEAGQFGEQAPVQRSVAQLRSDQAARSWAVGVESTPGSLSPQAADRRWRGRRVDLPRGRR